MNSQGSLSGIVLAVGYILFHIMLLLLMYRFESDSRERIKWTLLILLIPVAGGLLYLLHYNKQRNNS